MNQLDLFNTKSFFDTVKEDKQIHVEKANSQNEIIYRFFKAHPEKEISASIIEFNQILKDGTPLTSIRRALSTLKDRGLIRQVGTRKGQFDRNEFTYKIIIK